MSPRRAVLTLLLVVTLLVGAEPQTWGSYTDTNRLTTGAFTAATLPAPSSLSCSGGGSSVSFSVSISVPASGAMVYVGSTVVLTLSSSGTTSFTLTTSQVDSLVSWPLFPFVSTATVKVYLTAGQNWVSSSSASYDLTTGRSILLAKQLSC